MRILHVVPQLPFPPRGGAALRNWHFLRWLAGRHEVSLLAFGTPSAVLPAITALCARVRVAPVPERPTTRRLRDLLTSPAPDLALRLRHAGQARALGEWLAAGDFEVVQVEGLETAWVWQVAMGLLPRGGRPPRLVYDAHNAEYLLQWRAFRTDSLQPTRWPGAAYSLVQTLKLRRYEGRLCRVANRVVAVSGQDAAALRALARGARPLVIPNGVDCAAISYRDWSPGERLPARVLFTGTMNYRPNVDAARWFVGEVWPRLRARVPAAECWLVGASPSPAVQALARTPGVVVTGVVDDIRPYLAESTVFVVPMRIGGGVRLKVLEAMAAGIPLVSTGLGVEGVEARQDLHYLRADAPDLFADMVADLLLGKRDPSTMVREARRLVEAHYDWLHLCPLLEQALSADSG